MGKSVHTREYTTFLKALKAAREKSGLTQVELASSLGISQSHLSKMERGELRLDIVQTREICLALGTTLQRFVADFEKRLGDDG